MMRRSSKIRSPLQAGHTRMAFSSSSTMASVLSRAGAELGTEPFEREAQAFVGVHARLPPEQRARARDVGLTHLRVVLRQRLEDDFAVPAGEADDALGQVEEGHLLRVPDV